MSWLVRVGPIFERGTEANLKMVPIYGVPIPRSPTVQTNVDLSIHAQGEDLVISSSNKTDVVFCADHVESTSMLPSGAWGIQTRWPCCSHRREVCSLILP